MPNHCESDLYIIGTREQRKEVLDFIGMTGDEPTFDFNRLIPYPKRYADMDRDCPDIFGRDKSGALSAEAYKAKYGTTSDGFNSGGYGWCCANWGTKWNAYNVSKHELRGKTKVAFTTAWAPPRPVINALAAKFPDVEFTLKYYERGMGLKGVITFTNGEVVDAQQSDYHGERGG
jgi:hypothetical protein